jgi:hypothetical protein
MASGMSKDFSIVKRSGLFEQRRGKWTESRIGEELAVIERPRGQNFGGFARQGAAMRKALAIRAALVLVECLVSSAITIASGCGTVAKVQARDDMMQAKSAYTQCLTNN